MTNVEKLKNTALGSIRQRLGADSTNDDSYDGKINEMTPDELLEAWCGWHLGDPSWWTEMKAIYDKVNM